MSAADFAIEAQGLTRRFGNLVAVDQLTLSIPVGTVFGFLGPNGAGKTTTVRMLTALIGPTDGSALVNAQPLGAGNDAIRRSVGILTETPGLYERLTAGENLLFFGQGGHISHQETCANISLFAKEVFPRLQELNKGQVSTNRPAAVAAE